LGQKIKPRYPNLLSGVRLDYPLNPLETRRYVAFNYYAVYFKAYFFFGQFDRLFAAFPFLQPDFRRANLRLPLLFAPPRRFKLLLLV
jgi:hypothetical protein